RIGRTGRAGASGIAISFASLNEVNYLARIERYIGQTLPEHHIPGLEPSRPLRRVSAGSGRKPGMGAGPARKGSSNRPSGAAPGRSGKSSDRTSWGSRRSKDPVVEYRTGRHGAGQPRRSS
ncbi:MAG TPA: ATP-dependent helicase, partial [Geobacter sulfurreducens]|nr:ATP-dependent helicase [Geobacter sulfurreducens]